MKPLDIYYTSMHEFTHALGLRHTCNKKGDMICSAELIGGKLIYTDDENARDIYPDSKKPTDFNLDAIIHMYGKDGFRAPNSRLITPYFAYEDDMTTLRSNDFYSTSFDTE